MGLEVVALDEDPGMCRLLAGKMCPSHLPRVFLYFIPLTSHPKAAELIGFDSIQGKYLSIPPDDIPC